MMIHCVVQNICTFLHKLLVLFTTVFVLKYNDILRVTKHLYVIKQPVGLVCIEV